MNGAGNDEQPGTSMAATIDQDHWSQEDMLTLLESMKSILPSQESENFYSTESQLDWNKLAFKNYTGAMCQQKWIEISDELKKFRTLAELILEAEDHVKKNVKKLPEFPKKPLTAYIRFFIEKRAKYAKRHPELNNLDLTRLLSKRFRQLPKKKKMKYIEDFQREKQEFNRKVAIFREKQLELLQKSDIPGNPKTPQQLWYNQKRKRDLKTNPEARAKDVKGALGKQWSQLSEEKRLKWINKALEQQKKYENKKEYEVELMRFIKSLPKELQRKVLAEEKMSKSKSSQAEKKKTADEQEKLPKMAEEIWQQSVIGDYLDRFKNDQAKALKHMRSTWIKMGKKKKAVWIKEAATKDQKRYKSLPKEEQRRVLAEEKMVSLDKKDSRSSKMTAQDATKSKSKSSQAEKKKTADEQEKLPKMAEEIWQQSVIGDYLDRFKNDQAKALKHMRSTWIKMGKKKKAVWIKEAATKDQKRYKRELRSTSAAATPAKKIKIEGEPKKSPKKVQQNAPSSAKSKAADKVKSEEDEDDKDEGEIDDENKEDSSSRESS